MEEYPIAVNADIHQLDVDFVDEPDPLLNPVGVKGLGEVAMVGVAPAIANALFHATGGCPSASGTCSRASDTLQLRRS
jgi:xanthine dehydrogenase YagR molybdenum-binding subunit